MPPVHFALVILDIGVSKTISLGWPQTVILQISTSQIARITGMSHQRPAAVKVIDKLKVQQQLVPEEVRTL
jgi:hypothetical protein